MSRLVGRFHAVLIFVLLAAPSHAAVRYVNAASTASIPDGGSWDTAFRRVADALAAAHAGDEVWVAAAVYTERITLKEGVPLYGGFAGTETTRDQRDWNVHVTVLDGDKGGTVVTVPSGVTTATVLDGFTIRNGFGFTSFDRGYGGGGVFCDNSSPTFRHDTFRGNSTYSGYGGGLCCSGGSPVVQGCIFDGNTSVVGAGIYGEQATVTVTGCAFIGNKATSEGGGAAFDDSTVVFLNNTVHANSAGGGDFHNDGYGGGLFLQGGTALVADNLVAENAAYTQGGGIFFGYLYYAAPFSAQIVNNTIAANTSGAYDAGGLYGSYAGVPGSSQIVNNIIAYNTGGAGFRATTPVLRANCFFSNGASIIRGVPDPTGTDGNVTTDPLFASAGQGNYHIQPTSPCRDAGADDAVQAGWTDIDGQPRIQGAHVDIGADESDGGAWNIGARVYRVSPSGSDSNDGSSWLSPMQTVAGAANAASPGDEVWVAAGTYTGPVSLKSGVALFGGFAGNETARDQRNGSANITTIKGDASGSAIKVLSGLAMPTVIDGFVIRDGVALSGGAIYASGGSLTVSHNLITANTGRIYGGAISCSNANVSITDNVITGNLVTGTSSQQPYGASMWLSYCTGTVARNTITKNQLGPNLFLISSVELDTCTLSIAGNTFASHDGPALKSTGGSLTVSGNLFRWCVGGISQRSGGTTIIMNNRFIGNNGQCLDLSADTAVVANNVLAGNVSGMYVAAKTATVVNNTLVGNGQPGQPAFSYNQTTNLTLANNLVAFNAMGVSGYMSSGTPGTFTAFSNCVYGNTGADWLGIPDPTGQNGNIHSDPLLASLPYGNVHIQPSSPCVDAGSEAPLQPGWTDMDGQPRVQGQHVDIGADESDGTTWSQAPPVVRVRPGGDDAADGSSWTAAKRSVQAAVEGVLAQGGGEVWVAGGTYTENIVAGPFVHLFGGFGGTETARDARDWRANRTILDGNAAGTVVMFRAGQSNTLDGFTIRNGSATTLPWAYLGGGVRLAEGGGIACVGASALIAHNLVAGNQAFGLSQAYGAGVACYNSSSRIVDNVITGNTSANVGGGLSLYNSPAIVANNTIVGNGAAGGGAVVIVGTPNATLVNNIIAFNSNGLAGDPAGYGSPSPVLSHNDIYGNSGYNIFNLNAQGSNISADPLLVSAGSGSRHIQPTSPCRDAGDDTAVLTGDTDGDGQPRIQGPHVDIGADESDGTLWPSTIPVVRVSPNGSDSADGSSWAAAKRTVRGAVDALWATGGEVWVAAGTYPGNIVLGAPIGLYGGFAGTETDRSARDIRAHVTTIDAQGNGPVVSIRTGAQQCVVDGFRLVNGTGYDLSAEWSGQPGGTFVVGGGIYSAGADATIANNTITGCSAQVGGGVFLSGGTTTIAGNVITGNAANAVGGIACAANAYIADNLVARNTSAGAQYGSIQGTFAGAGICISSSSATLANNTVVFNSPVSAYASAASAGITCATNASARLVNNMVAFHGAGIALWDNSTASPSHNDVFGNGTNYSGMLDYTGVAGNLSADPRFANPDAGDYRLSSLSPCIDAGDDSAVRSGDRDVAGFPRIQGSHVDMGAYEFSGATQYTIGDVKAALSIAGGLARSGSADLARLNPGGGGSGSPGETVADALTLLRKVAGLDPNP